MQTNHTKISKLRAAVVAAVLLSLAAPAAAQYDLGYTHYMFNEFFVNPAYAGAKDALSIAGWTRNQWTGVTGAPRSASLNAHTPMAQDKIGLGLGFNYEKIGVHQQAIGFVDFAFRIHFPKGIWAWGLQGSSGYQKSRYNELKNLEYDPGLDPLLEAGPSKFMANTGVGTYYYTDRFFVGLSLPRIFNNDYVSGENMRLDARDWTYYLQSGYVFRINRHFELMPAAMLKLTAGVRPQLNVSALALLWQTLWLGADYRTDNSLAAIAGLQFYKRFRLTYSYDISMERTPRRYLGGSHELSLSWTFNVFEKKVVSPRLF